MEIITLGGGCFWCIEGVFLRMKGVVSAESGYTGGKTENPTYKDICSGTTGHAEVVQIKFDPTLISLEDLLEVFFEVHDPTTLNRQGNDVGTQYRSVIYYHNDTQKNTAQKIIDKVNTQLTDGKKVVTELSNMDKFYKAEDYHQNYYNENPGQPYCVYVVKPKIEKFLKKFSDKVKK